MTNFISLSTIKRDQAFQIVVKSYNLAEDYMSIAQRYRMEDKFVESKRFHAKSIHNIIRAYKIAIKYNFGIITKINVALTECGIKINEL